MVIFHSYVSLPEGTVIIHHQWSFIRPFVVRYWAINPRFGDQLSKDADPENVDFNDPKKRARGSFGKSSTNINAVV
jgi:hypothetical protein